MWSYMRMADAAAAARGEGVGFDAFCKFYETLVMAKARQQLRFKLGLQVEGACMLCCAMGWALRVVSCVACWLSAACSLLRDWDLGWQHACPSV
jgi:hypothetical protein